MPSIKKLIQVAGITMGTMFILDKAQNQSPLVLKFTGPRQTAIQKFMDYIIFWN